MARAATSDDTTAALASQCARKDGEQGAPVVIDQGACRVVGKVAPAHTCGVSVTDRLRDVAGRYYRVVRSPSYSPLWVAQLFSSFGDTLHYVAVVVLVYQLSGRGIAVAALVAAEIVPVLLLSPLAGVVIDRCSRKVVLIAADLFRAALVASLIWPQGLWHVYLVAAGLVVGSTFFAPTVQAIIPVLTNDDERLAANSVSWSTGRLVQIVGAAVAGGLIAAIGTGPAFAGNAATFLASAALIARLRVPRHAGQLTGDTTRGFAGYVEDARAGLAYALSDRFVSRLLLVQALAALAVGATSAMLVVLSEVHLRLPPAAFASLIGAIGMGALLGPLLPNLLARDYRDPRWLFVPYVVRGVGDVALAIFTPLPVALAILFVYGLSTSAGIVVFNSAIQDAVPEAVRGRIFTLLDVTWQAARLLSLLVGGLMVDHIGVQPLYWGGGVLLILSGFVGLALHRRPIPPGSMA